VFFFGWFSGAWILYADVSEYSVCSETSSHKIQTPKNYLIERTQHSIYSGIWKPRSCLWEHFGRSNIKNGNVIYNCYWEEAFKWRMLRPFTLGFQDFGKIILASNKIGECRNLHNFFLGDSRRIKYWLACPVNVKSFGGTHRRHVDYESIKTF